MLVMPGCRAGTAPAPPRAIPRACAPQRRRGPMRQRATPRVQSRRVTDDRTRSRRRARSVVVARPESRLMVVYPPALARAVPLPGAGAVIGRKPGAGGVELDDATLSRAHLQLEWESGWVAKDLGSRNGSWVNGAELSERAAVPDGAVLRIGDVLA